MKELSFLRGIQIIAGLINIILGCAVGAGAEISPWYIAFILVIFGTLQLFNRIKED